MVEASNEVNRYKYELAQDAIARGVWIADPEAGTLYSVKFRRYIVALNQQGYRRVMVWASPGQQFAVLVHRVLWEHNHGPIPDGLVINHLNGVKDDNRAANLEVVTQKANINHAHDTGLWPGIVRDRDKSAEIEALLRAGWSHACIAGELGVGSGTVSRVWRRMPDHHGPHRLDPDATEKMCTSCGVVKPLDHYGPRESASDGRMSNCKTCQVAMHRSWQAERNSREAVRPRRGSSKLSAAEVRQIRELVASGAGQHDVAVMFGIRACTVSAVVTRRTWKTVP